MNAPTAQIDFETRSACSLRKCGAWRYSVDPTTEILCLAFRLPYWEEGRVELWHPEFAHLGIEEADCPAVVELVQWIQNGGLVEAHNSWFERCIWTNILTVRYGFPVMNSGSWRCSAAKTAAHALPRGLDDAGAALHLSTRKDLMGHKLMMKMSKPRKSRKAERELCAYTGVMTPEILWHESADMMNRLWIYCRQDVLVEEELSGKLLDLNLKETQVYLMDQTINQRGFQLDMEAVTIALALIAKEAIKLNRELTSITGGVVKKATQRAQMLTWFQANGLDICDTQKETLDHQLQYGALTDTTRRALRIIRALGRSSTAKYQSMDNWAAPDGRVRGGLLYHGATTGRWSGAGVQPHNFVRGTVKDMEGLWAQLKSGVIVDNVMDALANALRGAIVASEGKTLYVADYAAIEARVVLWLAGDEDALDMFRRGEDIYLSMAGDIYGYECNKTHTEERQVGKQAILGLGFGMGVAKFQATCLEKAGVTIDDEMAQQVVNTYRERFSQVKSLWYEQERAAIRAVSVGGTCQRAGAVTWHAEGPRFLYCTLPSGRRLAYPFPKITGRPTPWGETRESLTFMGIDTYSKKWTRQHTYGGSLVENITQAVARDLMAEAMLRIEKSKTYELVLTVHDEIIAEAKLGTGSVKEFENLMATVPQWGQGCPVSAEGWSGTRYKK